MKTNKSPRKFKPLHYPGQSLDEAIREVQSEILEYVAIPAFILLLAVYLWIFQYFKIHPNPYIVAVMSLGLLGYSLFRIVPLFKKLESLNKGRDGEKLLGQQLEEFRTKGFKVVHDVPTGQGNIDHVLIGEKGIFTIETKTISKPHGYAKVHYDGKQLELEGIGRSNRPLIQARGEANWLRERLHTWMGKEFHVTPVVVFLGWWVETEDRYEIWVLNEKAFSKCVGKSAVRLKPEEVESAYRHLSEYIQSIDSVSV